MPTVGTKKYSYDEKGMKEAEQESMRTGIPVEFEDKNYAQYSGGGSVESGKRDFRGWGIARKGNV